MISKNEMELIIEKLMMKGFDFVDLFYEKRSNIGVKFEDRKLDGVTIGESAGLGIRCVDGKRVVSTFTEDLNFNNIMKIAEEIENENQRKKTTFIRSENLIKGDTSLMNLKGYGDIIPLKERVEYFENIFNSAYDKKLPISQIMINYGQSKQEVAIMNSLGVYAEDLRLRSKCIFQSVASKNGEIQSAYDSLGWLGNYQYLIDENLNEIMTNTLKKSVNLLSAKNAPSGTMDVVLSGEAGGTMVHEACGHGLEGDIVKKGMSVYGGKIGEIVASPLITVIDDGTIKGRYGTEFFDDEGTKTRKNILIEKGVLKGYMSDYLTSKELGIPTTGNGRREGYHAVPITRMTNTYIASGNHKKEDIIASVEEGLFVKKMGGGQVNTSNGDFVFEVIEGYLIKNGKLKEQVKGATLIGNGPEVLNKISMVGDDFGYSLGTCGKDGQGVPVADGQPTLKIPNLVVGGVN